MNLESTANQHRFWGETVVYISLTYKTDSFIVQLGTSSVLYRKFAVFRFLYKIRIINVRGAGIVPHASEFFYEKGG